MRFLPVICAALCVFGCSQIAPQAPIDALSAHYAPSLGLSNLVHVDASSADTQHPLVCGVEKDFPDGQELTFRNSESQEFIHAVFPIVATAPKDLSGTFVLHGHYQTIQNRSSYTLKHPPKDYRYFVVTSWKQNKQGTLEHVPPVGRGEAPRH